MSETEKKQESLNVSADTYALLCAEAGRRQSEEKRYISIRSVADEILRKALGME